MESAQHAGSFLLHKRTAKILTGQLEPLLVSMAEAREATLPTDAVGLLQQHFEAALPTLRSTPPMFCGVAKHVFSHRVHQLAVCRTVVDETAVGTIEDYTWWSPERIREAGTTSWFLLVATGDVDET